MVVSENTLKWIMRFYPPLLFQRIWVVGFDKGFSGVRVKVFKSIFNKNYNGSIFGGTIFAAADPFYPVLFDRVLNTSGRKLKIWSKSSRIDFLKPALSSLSFRILLSDADIDLAIHTLNNNGKYEHGFMIEIYDKNNEVCVAVIYATLILNKQQLYNMPVYMNDEAFAKKGYIISADKTLLSFDTIFTYLDQHSYWAKGIPAERLKTAIDNSLCFGVYKDSIQAGFARLVTDKATFAYLCDVFILPGHRGAGLSKWLVQTIMAHPDLQGLRRWCLATQDAHGLYKQFGFKEVHNPEVWMQIFTPYIAD